MSKIYAEGRTGLKQLLEFHCNVHDASSLCIKFMFMLGDLPISLSHVSWDVVWSLNVTESPANGQHSDTPALVLSSDFFFTKKDSFFTN